MYSYFTQENAMDYTANALVTAMKRYWANGW
jgi:hypothetical protein